MKELKIKIPLFLGLLLIALFGCSSMKPSVQDGKARLSMPFEWANPDNPANISAEDISNNTTELIIP